MARLAQLAQLERVVPVQPPVRGAVVQSSNDCQNGLACCYPCGTPGCSNQCVKPDQNGRCPAFP